MGGLGDDGEGPHADTIAVVRTLRGEVAPGEQHLTGDIRVCGDDLGIIRLRASGDAGEKPSAAAGTVHTQALPSIGGGGDSGIRSA